METKIAYCGLNCAVCPAYIATQEDDYEEIKKVAEMWSNDSMLFKPEEVYCDGCKSNEKVFTWCTKCPTRKCCNDKGLENCAYCKDYFCDNLKQTFDNDPSAKERLDEIRKKL
ncbi:MAG: DUF3795 domain-containing protein [Promethearchaeota archaeon]|jgi:hypothetical protein